MERSTQERHCNHTQSGLSALRKTASWSARCYRLGLVLVALGGSAPAHAILSCQAGAGPTLGGAFDECAPLASKFEANAESTHGNASVSALTGSMAGMVTVAPSTFGDGRFYGELIVDFRINGPAPSGSVPVDFIFSTEGSIAGDCTNCEANIGASHRIDSVSFSGFQMRTSAARTRTSDWISSHSEFDTSGLGLDPSYTADGITSGRLSFDAAMVLGHTFRLTANLSGNAHLTGPNAPEAFLTADASHTALFNILVPAGYSVSANPAHYPFLTAPILQPVPEPSTYILMAVGLGLVGVAARHRIRS
jgi:hypothetical protein